MQGSVRLVCRHHTTYRYSRLAVGHTATVVLELWWSQDMGHQQNLLTTPSHACFLLWRSISWLLLGFGLISRFLSGSTLFGADIFRVHLSISSCWREENFFLQALDLGPGDLDSRSGFALGPLFLPLLNEKTGLEWLVYQLCFRRPRCSVELSGALIKNVGV